MPFAMRAYVIAIAVFGAACNSQYADTETTRADAVRHILDANWVRYIETLKGGQPDAIAAWFTQSAVLMEPGVEDLRGRAAIQTFLAKALEMLRVVDVTIEPVELEVYRDSAYEFGTYKETIDIKDKGQTAYAGRYSASWKRQADDSWRIHRLLLAPTPIAGAP